jgi:dipeptidyl aminopeptidase/acylaminoacyl peptidase
LPEAEAPVSVESGSGMKTPSTRSRRHGGVGLRILSVLGAAALVLALGAAPASAVYAGSNGRVAYTLYSGSGSDIFSVAANGTGTRRLTFDGRSSHPRWSPGGGLLAFQRGSTATTGAFTGDLWVMRADGSGVHRVTSGAGAQQPAWSPDTRALMFVKRVNGHSDLFRLPVAGGGLKRVTFAAASGCDADHPSWRGSLVVYHRLCAGKSDEIRLLNLTTRVNRVVVAGRPAAGESVSWPDFTRDLRIMFLACLQSDPVCLSTQNVHVVNRDGTGLQVLTDSTGCCSEPRYRTPVPSPDGTTYLVAQVSGTDGGPPAWILGGPGNPPRPLLRSGANPALEPDWQRKA